MKASIKTVSVNRDIIHAAYDHFTEVYYPDHKNGRGLAFWKFIGDSNKGKYVGPSWQLPENAAEKAAMLAGPHYRTICKAMEANGADWSDEELLSN